MLEKYDITSNEFTELIALYSSGPDVGDRVDYGMAQLCAVTATSAMGSKRAFRADEFLPKWGVKRDIVLSDQDTLELFRNIQAATDG